MRTLLLATALAVTFLAGCSEESTPDETGDDDFSGDLDQQLEATEDTGIIRGVVVDPAVTPVSGVNITLAGTGQSTTTNDAGAFGFSDLEPGTYFVEASKPGFESTQSSTAVEAGVDKPPIVKIQLVPDPESGPYVVPTQLNGFLACGVAVFATSIGCTILGPLADATQSTSIWRHEFDSDRIQWTQGELVWEQTQPAGGEFIWEITERSNDHIGYRETTGSPALAYVNTTILHTNGNDILSEGVDYRFFGGPHPMCKLPEPIDRPDEAPVWYTFGCGVTVDQAAEVFIHDFYNFAPDEGWRFTSDGAHPVPA